MKRKRGKKEVYREGRKKGRKKGKKHEILRRGREGRGNNMRN